MGNVLAFLWVMLLRGLAELHRLGAVGLVILAVLGFGGEARAEPKVPLSELPLQDKIVCERAPGVPNDIDVWAIGQHNKLYYSRTGLYFGSIPKPITFYVFRPDHPKCQKNASTTKANVPQDGPPPMKVTAPPPTEVPKKEGEKKNAAKDEKPEAKTEPTSEAPAKRDQPPKELDDALLEARRTRAREARKHAPPPPRKERSGAELAREQEDEQETEAHLPWVRRSFRPTPMTTSACPGCGVKTSNPLIVRPGGFACRASAAPGSYVPGPRGNPATRSPVREPILKELLAYERAPTDDDKELNREELWKLFYGIPAPGAEAFHAMLATDDSLGVKLRDVLEDDPFQKELISVLERKYLCNPPPPPSPPSPPAGVTLPSTPLTDDGSFDALDEDAQGRIEEFRQKCNGIVRYNLSRAKAQLQRLVPIMEKQLADARRAKEAAFKETDPVKRAAAMKRTGDIYTGLAYVAAIWQVYGNIAVVTDQADEAGLPSSLDADPAANPLAQPLLDFENDEAIHALYAAGQQGNAAAITAALPEAQRHVEMHVNRLDKWAAAINKGSVLSKRVMAAADVLMIATSIWQVWKAPVLAAGSAPPPLTITGVLPGGAAIGSTASLASIARSVEAIRRLVAIGALDGALIGGLSTIGGGPGVALPEFQRPTNWSVAAPKNSPGAPESPAARAQRMKELVKEAQKEYPKKAGKIEKHHERPRFLGGKKNERTVPIDAAYHQKITNEFRSKVPYGTIKKPGQAEVEELMNEVYEKFPIPK